MQSCLDLIPDDIDRVFVAFSGGVDSSVLLHLAVNRSTRGKLIAWHINHGLLDVAPRMERFCREQASGYGIEFKVDRLELANVDGNVEAEARRRRYELFERFTGRGDCILTAHHADDQAETFILNALRGSGSAGLRGIARRRRVGDALLLRPLLDYDRAELEAYAASHEVPWFDDPSNRSSRFDRNYLRHEVLPGLKQRWPACARSLARASELQSETHELLEDLAALDLDAARAAPSAGTDTLAISKLLDLSLGRQKNLLRYWIRQCGYAPLPHARLLELTHQLHAGSDAAPEIEMGDYSIRIYDRRVFLVPPDAAEERDGVFEFGLEATIGIERYRLNFRRDEIFRQLGIEDSRQSLTLKFRGGTHAAGDRHRLRRLFQKYRIPPWERSRVPQVYLDGRLQGILP